MSRILLALAAVSMTGACIATAIAQGLQQDLLISATVPSTCTLGGTPTPSALNMSIPIDGAGNVNTATQTFVVNNVICTMSTSVLATSMNGGVRSAQNPGVGFTNIIDYRGTAVFGKAKSVVDTNVVPGAKGSESGKAASTGKSTKGSLVIQVRPVANTQPLAGGTDYQDTLKITLTPD